MTHMKWDMVRRRTPGPDLPKPARVPRRKAGAKVKPFRARFPGWCANCHKDFGPGCLLRYNKHGRVVHAKRCPSKGR